MNAARVFNMVICGMICRTDIQILIEGDFNGLLQ